MRAFAEQAVAVKLTEPDWETFYELVSSEDGKREISSLRSAFNETKKELEKMGVVRIPSVGSCFRILAQAPLAHLALHRLFAGPEGGGLEQVPGRGQAAAGPVPQVLLQCGPVLHCWGHHCMHAVMHSVVIAPHRPEHVSHAVQA